MALAAILGSEPARSEAETYAVSKIQHDLAITLARDGDHAEALEILARLRIEHPEDAQLLYDETVILTWADRDADAAANAADIDREEAPDYVLDAVAKAYGRTGRQAEAAAWYQALLDRDPQNVDARLGLAFSYVDADNIEAARVVLGEAPEAGTDQTRLTLAEADLFEREGRHIDALARYQAVLETSPGNAAALRGMALVLRELLLPRKALAIADQHPGILDKNEIAQLEADIAALEIREGSQAQYPEERRFEATDRALARLEALLAEPDVDQTVRQRLEYDRVVALADRGRTAEAVEAFEALDEAPDDLPVYVLERAATAYLDEHQPSKARPLLENAIERAPENLELNFRMFFVYADLRDFDKADSVAEKLLTEIAASRPADDPAYLRARILVGLSRAYADRLGDAQQYFESLTAEIPHNTQIRGELANVYRWRGWVDRSLEQYGQILAVEPNFVAARVGETHTLLDAHEYDDVERALEELESRHGKENAVRTLARRWENHNRNEIYVETRFGESSGTTFGDEQYEINASWYSRPFNNRYRALVRTHDAFAEFPEGDAHRKRAGLGVDYAYARWRATATVSADRSGGDAGIGLDARYRFSDQLTFGGRFETQSTDTPLRGYRVGVSSELLSVNTRYAPDEATSIGLTLSTQHLSDGNRARSLLLDGVRRILNRPSLKLAAIGEVYGSSRTRDDVAYFSPRHDSSWLAGFRTRWVTYRNHRLDFSQTLSLQAGRYDQAGYAAGGIWAADYRLSVALEQRWYVDMGARRQRGFYDGAGEYATWFIASLGGRF
jgi:biofilm PGA synthesis protein PgaA